ncbi:hypothetical protein FACS1894219_07570 [Clostridia bacterium]|nr:hypothetical protein FACS1894219_07570 [Clostridia bacterium]
MTEQFTLEQINLMCIFDTSDRNSLIADIKAAIPIFDDPEITEIAENAVSQLEKMSGAKFSALNLYPEYNDYDDESGG